MSRLSRLVLAYFVAVPLALVLGFMVAVPNMTSAATVGFVLFCLAFPLLLQWHHTLVVVFWSSAFTLGFMPGEPRLWLVLAVLSFGISAVNHILGLKSFVRAPELMKPILFLLLVILVTAWFRGGVGSKILGGSGYGGKKYIYILGAILGYFALTAQRIPIHQSGRMVKWFFLSAVTFAFGNIIYALGPAFYVLYYFVSPDTVGSQAASDAGLNVVDRFAGLGAAGTGLLCYILARWGIRRIFEWHKPWRLLLLTAAVMGALFSGFRSQVVFLFAVFAIQFTIEGLWKTYFLPGFLLVGVLCLAPMLLFAHKMPASVQRSLAFLPMDINPDVREEAKASSDWRYQMWQEVWPEVPQYLLLGKGYSIDPIDLYLTEQASREGLLNSYEIAVTAGDYHSGPLSVLIPFGMLGAIAVVWLLGAGIKALYSNYCYGEVRLRQVNMVLLSYFLAQCLFFFFVFGALSSQLAMFLGILGFSVSLNGGVRHKEEPKAILARTDSALMLEPA